MPIALIADDERLMREQLRARLSEVWPDLDIVAEARKVLGYVNRFGRGVLAAQEALHENGNPPARYTFEPASVTVSAHKSKHFS